MASPVLTKRWPLRDTRYFECPTLMGGKESHNHAGTLFHVTQPMHAWPRRLAACCRERLLSIGHAHHLYLWLTPALPEGEIRPSDFSEEHWLRWVLCGLPESFNYVAPGTALDGKPGTE